MPGPFAPPFNYQFGSGPGSTPPTSGTYDFFLTNADIIVEAYERIQIGPAAFEPRHLISARRSTNIILQDWSNRGVNLWTVQQYSIPLSQGVPLYGLAPEVVNPLDVYIRTYQIGGLTNIAPQFTTTQYLAQLQIYDPNHQLSIGEYLQIAVPVSVGGIVVYGYYQVTSVIDANNILINPGQAPIVSVTGGQVPVFTSTAGSETISVNLPAHGLVAGQNFPIGVNTNVGGTTVFGSYPVITVIDANNFTINATSTALINQTVSENGGLTQIGNQVQNTAPVDIMLYPLSRDDYAMIPDKFQQGRPTTFWFDRLINTTMTLWQVPDATQPYELMFFAMTKIQDANPISGEAPQIPGRFLQALIAELTAAMAEKFRPEMHTEKLQLAAKAWDWASGEDREKAPTYISPDLDGYFND